ncbi:MAG TPA: glycosyltransferase [Actinomycetota bacterium]
MSDPPEEVRRLAEERAAKRAARDFGAADELRDRILDLGWIVRDAAGGFDLEPAGEPEAPLRVRVEDVASVLDEAPTHDVSVHWLPERWPDDVVRGIESFRRHQGVRTVQHVVVETTEAAAGTWPDDVEVVRLERHPGFGSARNAGLRRSRGRVVVIADGSIEADGDVLGPLEAALADPTIGVAGPFGIVTRDLQAFEESDGPEVDAIEAYLMALRRELLDEVRFHRAFRFYRSADIDLSFQVKALGLRAVRVEVPVTKHEHRRWTTTPPELRWRWSKKNFYRFLDRFRGRDDLLATRPDLR